MNVKYGAVDDVRVLAGAPSVVEVVVRRRGEVVVPRADEDVHPGPAQESLHVEDLAHRRGERVGVETVVSARQPAPSITRHSWARSS